MKLITAGPSGSTLPGRFLLYKPGNGVEYMYFIVVFTQINEHQCERCFVYASAARQRAGGGAGSAAKSGACRERNGKSQL